MTRSWSIIRRSPRSSSAREINSWKTKKPETGAVLIEFVLSLPLILLIIYGIIFVSYASNLQTQLSTAVRLSPLLAVTRGFPDIYVNAPNLLTKTDAYHSGAGSLPEYLYHGVSESDAEGVLNENWLDPDFSNAVGDVGFSESPLVAKYLIAYAFEYLRLSLGPGVRYPCIPNGSLARAGCISCSVIFSAETMTRLLNPIKDAPLLEMVCSAQMPRVFTELLSGMLSFFGGRQDYLVFSASTYSSERRDSGGGGGPLGPGGF